MNCGNEMRMKKWLSQWTQFVNSLQCFCFVKINRSLNYKKTLRHHYTMHCEKKNLNKNALFYHPPSAKDHYMAQLILLTSPGLTASIPFSIWDLCWPIDCLFICTCLLRFTISISRGRTWLSPWVPDTAVRYSWDKTIP